jgi:hypothetical protein
MATLEADYDDAAFPLELVVNLIGSGGVPGLACTVAVRLSPTLGFYLDWTTNTFKNVGWGLKDKPMVGIGNGVYQVILNVSLLGFTPLTGLPQKIIAEYTSTGAGTSGLTSDTIFISELRPDAETARQYQSNRLEALGGLPGTLTLYEDDGVTVKSVQALHDFAGGAVVDTPGTPAKRS